MNKINHRQIQDLIQLGFDTTNTTDDATVAGRLSWNTDESTLDLGMGNDVSLQIGHELFFDAINQTGSTITDGTPVMFAGTLGASGKALIQEAIADGSLLPEYIMGIVTHDIADGDSGKVTWFGKVRGIDTSGTPYSETWADGDLLWVSQTTVGYLTNVEPTDGQKILVAAVIKAHASAGTLLVRPTWCKEYANPNILTNGCLRVWQAGTSFTSTGNFTNADDSYTADNIILLSDGNDIVDVTQETSVIPAGAYSAMKLDVETANKKFGILIPVEAKDAVDIIGSKASLSFEARVTGTSISNIRAAVLSWSGTADTITSDVVSAWNGAGSNPTLVTNWTYENTPSSIAMTTSYKKIKIPNISIDTASTKNVAVFIWCDDVTTTIGDFLYIAKIKLEHGESVTRFEHNSYAEELAKCVRLFQIIPSVDGGIVGFGQCFTTTNAYVHLTFEEKRIAVAPTIVNPTTDWYLANAGGGNTAVTSYGTTTRVTRTSALIFPNVAAGLTAGDATMLYNAVVGALMYVRAGL